MNRNLYCGTGALRLVSSGDHLLPPSLPPPLADPPQSGEGGQPAASSTASAPSVLIADCSDAHKTLKKLSNGWQPSGRERVDWKKLRKVCRRQLRARRAFAVLNHEPHGKRQERFRDYIRSAGWCFVAAGEEVFWHTPSERPVDLWIDFWLGVEVDFGSRPNDIVVVTHRGFVVPTLTRILEAGAQVAILGLLGFFDPRLVELSERHPDRCKVLDIELDCKAVNLPFRWDSFGLHDYPEQLSVAARE